MLDRGENLCSVLEDACLELDEGLDPTASGPGDPSIECLRGFVERQPEEGAQAFLEEVGAVEPRVGLRDPSQLCLLAQDIGMGCVGSSAWWPPR